MLGNESLWEVAAHCDKLLNHANIAHSICGGVAVCLHGYERNTTDIDLIIDKTDSSSVKQLLTADGFEWDEQAKEFRSPGGIPVQFLMAGDRAGKGLDVTVPEPTGDLNVELIEGLTVVRLSRLIEMKLASGMGNLRRTHKDFADVVELIAIRKLDSSFARFLHASVHDTFRKLVKNAQAVQ
jgi:hypothetical protein